MMVDVASVPALLEADEYPETIPALQNGWRPTGGPVNLAADGGLLNWPLEELAKRTRWLHRRYLEGEITSSFQVTVGAGGHFATIGSALQSLVRKRPKLQSTEVRATIRLLNGFVMAEQVIVRGIDLGWIKIIADAAEVVVTRAALVAQVGDQYPAFGGEGFGALPEVAALFSMDTSGASANRTGVAVTNGMAARVAAGAGLKGCPNFGLIAQTADVHAQGAVFSNAGVDGVRATRGARVAFRSGIATGCGGFGIRAETGALIDANSAVLSACVGGGAHATALGRVELNLANCRSGAANATTDIQVSAGGQINAPSVTGGTNIAKNTVTANGVIFG